MGPVGSEKLTPSAFLSDIEVIDTDVAASDETALIKDKTTVAMDVGVLELGGGDKLRLYGAPGQGSLRLHVGHPADASQVLGHHAESCQSRSARGSCALR